MDMKCPYCNSEMSFHESNAFIYDGRHFGAVFACARYPDCDTYVGVHKGSNPPKPLGSPANAELRKARKGAHAALDPLWRDAKLCSRSRAYGALANVLGIERSECHIGLFDLERCAQVVAMDVRDFQKSLDYMERNSS